MKYIFFILFSAAILHAQSGDIKIGTNNLAFRNYTGAYFDYSEADGMNMKVSIWGNVKFPGIYFVPVNINARDLISYAGGPSNDARLDDLRIYRIMPDSSQTMIKFDYNDLLWNDRLISRQNSTPQLNAGDVLLVPGKPRLYFQEYFSMSLSVASTLISLAILIINLAR